ncbi:hypothetical protein DFA_10884 [Cavenderia fasciculata]|uniref:FAD dependent oxidoreductase domain-containing protein n=1 Tax=Cavenderia fasciculata TaxID=261658 RepID=F4QBN8_CACFS|nr:uncharacterized protein DFA_10884 [Cavenderia fasciculata]EGG14626.1 hypothetical protein DFA_10884 [Cavenderia fasciculata]|eukprot:XP_004351134.1 hypothetical protein DFA_10884 [Cavenderia fasciculata]
MAMSQIAVSTIRNVTIIGGGAAGLTTAIFAKQTYPHLKVTILERKREAGKKILMSGGTRCNVLPKKVDIRHDYFSEDMNIAKKIMSSWNVDGCYKWLSDDIGLKLELEEETNKYFPHSNSARDVRDKLRDKCINLGVDIVYNRRVDVVHKVGGADDNGDKPSTFRIKGINEQNSDEPFNHLTDAIVVSSGGLSFPAVGTDGSGYRIAKSMGHSINPTYAALTPLKGMPIGGDPLAGLSMNLALRVSGVHREPIVANRSGFLFTHKGFSGPSILDLSHYCVKALESNGSIPLPSLSARLDGADKTQWTERLANANSQYGTQNQLLSNRLGVFIPHNFVDRVMTHLNQKDKKMNELSSSERKVLVEFLSNMPVEYTGHDGYKKAEVTGGGVPLTQINHQNLEKLEVLISIGHG